MKNVLALNSFGTATGIQRHLLAAGPLNKQPGTLPTRVVLVELIDGQGNPVEFAVYDEVFQCDMGTLADVQGCNDVIVSSTNNGNYFRLNEFPAATVKFAERLKRNAEMHYQSIYREEAAA